VDLSELNVLLTVARERSFSRAAQKLFRTQPAVSIAILLRAFPARKSPPRTSTHRMSFAALAKSSGAFAR